MKNINDLQIGKAGEYLVCADLILQGHIAFISEQGLPYDVIADCSGKLLRVQVKTTRGYKYIPQRKTDIPAYIFHVGPNGSNKSANRKTKYKKEQVDFFALVSLDTKEIAYIPFFDCQTTMNFRVPTFRGKYHDEQAIQNKKKVLELKKDGKSCEDISRLTGMKLSLVYKYSANVSIEQKGTNAGVYFNEFNLEKCLSQLQS